MFTGIVEELGAITAVSHQRISIHATQVMLDTRLGDSIAVDGVCLTVTERISDGFAADTSPETLQRTTLGNKKSGDTVNLERALRLQDRLGGHLMLGHVDGVGTIRAIEREGNSIWLRATAPQELMRYIAMKGSIGINGISLTVAGLGPNDFAVVLIPHTIQETTLHRARVGDPINLEVDLLSRYVERLMTHSEPTASPLSTQFLAEHGFA